MTATSELIETARKVYEGASDRSLVIQLANALEKSEAIVRCFDVDALRAREKRESELEAQLTRYQQALEFYADADTWSRSTPENPLPPISSDSDGPGYVPGNRARAALEKCGGKT